MIKTTKCSICKTADVQVEVPDWTDADVAVFAACRRCQADELRQLGYLSIEIPYVADWAILGPGQPLRILASPGIKDLIESPAKIAHLACRNTMGDAGDRFADEFKERDPEQYLAELEQVRDIRKSGVGDLQSVFDVYGETVYVFGHYEPGRPSRAEVMLASEY